MTITDQAGLEAFLASFPNTGILLRGDRRREFLDPLTIFQVANNAASNASANFSPATNTITKVGHGFSLPSSGVLPVRIAGGGVVEAKAQDYLFATHVAIAVPDADNITVQNSGLVTVTGGHGLTPLEDYCLGSSGGLVLASALDAKLPKQPLLQVLDANTIQLGLRSRIPAQTRYIRLFNQLQTNLNNVTGNAMVFDDGNVEGNDLLATPSTAGLTIVRPGEYQMIIHLDTTVVLPSGTVQNLQRPSVAIALTVNGNPQPGEGKTGYIRRNNNSQNLAGTAKAVYTANLAAGDIVGGFGRRLGRSGNVQAYAGLSYLELIARG